ncbi:MAG: DNA repair protein RecO [Candidatus Poribacteria bacterium]|nr:DNA repair protein RecO [Candidatus Poribacteria bacterium]MDE0504580.1 DNA repair protein RecO [Candidatus Poribacteria bacterium]
MPVQKTDAIVIRSYPFGEFHKIIIFYTSDFGKVRAAAYGVRGPKSRFGGSLELLNRGTLVFSERPNKDLRIVQEFGLTDAFDGIKADYDRTTYGCYLAELVNAIESEHSANQGVFRLLQHGFDGLTRVNDIALLARGFELKLLDITGFAPQLSQCVVCSSHPPRNTLRFSTRLGGVLCDDCTHNDSNAPILARGSCELMKFLRRCDLVHLDRVQASRLNHRELQLVLSRFISYHTELTLKSLELIEDLNSSQRM